MGVSTAGKRAEIGILGETCKCLRTAVVWGEEMWLAFAAAGAAGWLVFRAGMVLGSGSSTGKTSGLFSEGKRCLVHLRVQMLGGQVDAPVWKWRERSGPLIRDASFCSGSGSH